MVVRVLVLTALVSVLASCARADRDIVYAEQRYRWSGEYYRSSRDAKPEEKLAEVGDEQIYRIDPDGSGKARLLPRGWTGSRPVWSPDGRWVLFLGRRSGASFDRKAPRVCVVASGGGRPRILDERLAYGVNDVWELEYSWSPNGKRIALALRDWDKRRRRTVVVDRTTRWRRVVPNCAAAAWSPDSHRLCGTDSDSRGVIVDVRTGARTPMTGRARFPHWLDNARIVDVDWNGDVPEIWLSVFNASGALVRKQPLTQIGGRPIDDGIAEEVRLVARPGRSRLLGATAHWGRSDGGAEQCFRLDVDRGTITYLYYGRLLAFSPDRSRFLACTFEWVGPYKRGGERLGALELRPVFGKGMPRSISPQMVQILGADWRKPPRVPAAAHPRRAP